MGGREMTETVDKFAEYALIIEDTARFTERRQTISNNYVAINSLLLAGIGVLIKDVGAQGSWVLLLPLPLAAAGVAVSLWWRELIYRNKELVRLRMGVLHEMESKLPGAEMIYHREDALYPKDKAGRDVSGQRISISDLEGRLPLLFLALYGVFGAGLAISLAAQLAAG
jgi:hypothetical protein